MNNIDIVSTEVAMMAKELNYPFTTSYFYCDYGLCTEGEETLVTPDDVIYDVNNEFNEGVRYYAPTHAELDRWLREEFNEYVNVIYIPYNKSFSSSLVMRSMGWSGFETKEEAYDKGLLESMKIIKKDGIK